MKSIADKKWSKEAKELIAKEVCAFANTYGGVICLHGIPDIESPLDNSLLSAVDALEGFLKDCLEPRLLGVAIKEVEGRLIIDVPESCNKPHRSAMKGKQYYYRHATSSQPMEEIMIGAMYRSQSVLEVRVSGIVDNHVRLMARNNSNLVGTKPQFEFELLFRWTDSVHMYSFVSEDFQNGCMNQPIFSNLWSKKKGLKDSFAQTGKIFRDEILYPQGFLFAQSKICLLYTSPSPRDLSTSRMPSSA